MVGRSDMWNDRILVRPGLLDPDSNPELTGALRAAWETAGLSDDGFLSSILRTAHEVIFRQEDDGDHFQVIGFALDARTGCLALEKSFDIFGFDDDEDSKRTLALAVSYDIPIYPEDASDVRRLSLLYESLYSAGIHVDQDGQKTRLVPTFKAAHRVDLEDLDHSTKIQPIDFYVREAANRTRLAELVEAERVVAGLRLAIEELSAELAKDVRDENALQRLLTARPSLLGLEYRQVIPKHSLGGEYELDYAAITTNGFVHCIEIEPSTLKLYGKGGNPRAELVHAEQQVLDWLDWMDRHAEYASAKLPTLLRPTGTVVMGRRRDLTDRDVMRLERRNAAWSGTLRVLTYDDLVDQARATLSWLTHGFGPDSNRSITADQLD
jgi:hypothetical protein